MKPVGPIMLVVSAMACAVHAQIVFNNTDGSERNSYAWTFTNLNVENPDVSTANGTAAGLLTGAGSFGVDESFTIEAEGWYGWNTEEAQSAANDFGAYLLGLSAGGVGAMRDGNFGVDAPSDGAGGAVEHALEGTVEVLVLTARLSNLSPASSLSFNGMLFSIYDDAARTDFLIYDASENALVHAQWKTDFNPSDAIAGRWILGDGDKVLIATASNNLSTKWRVNEFSLDVEAGEPDPDPPLPNPAQWADLPSAEGPFSIGMAAVTGSDESGVEYYFAETSGNPGGADSGWQSSPAYTNAGLSPATEYSYTVQMRDLFGNIGETSDVAYAETPAITGRTNGPPNVVIIYADDLGYADISHNASPGSLVHTPNIDRICHEGIYFSNYMTHHVCSPSRAGFLTGKHYTRVGAGAEVGGTLDNSIPNIAKDFKAAGYATACFGKWHNGSPPYSDDGSMVEVNKLSEIIKDDLILQYIGGGFGEGVNAYGFDEWAGFYGGGYNYHTRLDARDINWWINGTYSAHVTGYNTYIIRDNALNFIDAHAQEPFFLYVPMEAVHSPMDILNTDLKEMCDIWDDTYPSLAWSAVGELASPTSGRKIKDVMQLRCSGGHEFDMNLLDAELPGFHDLVYYTLAYAMDQATGEILDRLDAYGLATNTIVVFASDNGGVEDRGDNAPFRGGKHTVWEGGVHVPAAIWWPERLDANTAPYSPADNSYTHMTQYLDWYPTLIDMAGQPLYGTDLDGINLYSNLVERTPVRTDLNNCYYGLDDMWCTVRSDRWKLHFNRVEGNQVLELYDLHSDIGEATNVQAAYPVERDALIGLLDAWFATTDVTASYMPLTGASIPRYTEPAPMGDVLEVAAVQTDSLADPDRDGVYIRFAGTDKDSYIHAADMLVYDIYVAADSDQVSGMFCSPSLGATPRFNSYRGIHTNSVLWSKQVLPKGKWVRMMSGMGEIAANGGGYSFIALHNPDPGYYHFYIDNLSIRREDGSLRGVSWDNRNDTYATPWYLLGGTTYRTWSAALAAPGFPYSDIQLNTVDLSTLPPDPDSPGEGASYGSWASIMGGVIGDSDPAEPGPVNRWPILLEYGLGSDPTTFTAGLLPGTNPPVSGELGTYTFRNLANTNFMTLTFNFNRSASDIEIVLAESSNLVDWVDSVVLRPPYVDTAMIETNRQVVEVADNPGGSPVETTRVTARGSVALDDEPKGFLRLEVRPLVAVPETPANLAASPHGGILLEWSGALEKGEYVVERALSGSGDFVEITRTDRQLHTDTTAVAGQPYDYRVRAVNAAGATAWSNTATGAR